MGGELSAQKERNAELDKVIKSMQSRELFSRIAKEVDSCLQVTAVRGPPANLEQPSTINEDPNELQMNFGTPNTAPRNLGGFKDSLPHSTKLATVAVKTLADSVNFASTSMSYGGGAVAGSSILETFTDEGDA